MLGPGADHGRWITHRNHLGEELGVDYIWYRNPDEELGPMEPDWENIVYQVSLVLEAGGCFSCSVGRRSVELRLTYHGVVNLRTVRLG